jgi:TolB-like protein
MRRFSEIVLATIGLLLITGCATNLSSQRRIESKLPRQARIAVLPFENLSSTERAGEKLTENFVTELLAQKGLEVAEFGTVYDALRRSRIRSSSLVTDTQLQELAGELNVRVFVTGAVLEYEEYDNQYLGKVPQVSFNVRVIDGTTGETVWVGSSNGRGDKGEVVFGIGAVKSADRLALDMVRNAVNDIVSLFGD